MHIYKTSQGSWAYRIDVGKNPRTGKRLQKSKSGFLKKKDAEAAARSLLESIAQHRYVKETPITFGEFSQDWLRLYAQNVKKASVRIREHQLGILKRHFDKIPIQEISKKDYQLFLLSLGKQYAVNTISGVHTTARMIFKKAREFDVLYQDPTEFAAVARPKRGIINPDDDIPAYLEKEDLDLFLKQAKSIGHQGDYPLFALLSYTGVRIGEAQALTWEDIDFTKKLIRINKTIYNPTNNRLEYELTSPKTERSIRIIDIPTFLVNVLRAHKSENNKLRLLYGISWHKPDGSPQGFVFTSPSSPGYPLTQRFIQNRLDRIQKFLELPMRLHPHLFRHTHASLLAEAGVGLDQIMDRLGHTDDNTTKRIYLHITKDRKLDASEKFADLMAKIN